MAILRRLLARLGLLREARPTPAPVRCLCPVCMDKRARRNPRREIP